jgi:hypothetical protein
MPIVQQKPIPFFIAKIEVINTTNMSHRIYDRLPEELRGKLIETYEASMPLFPKPPHMMNYFFEIYNNYFNLQYARSGEAEDLEDVTCSNCRVKVDSHIWRAINYYKTL